MTGISGKRLCGFYTKTHGKAITGTIEITLLRAFIDHRLTDPTFRVETSRIGLVVLVAKSG